MPHSHSLMWVCLASAVLTIAGTTRTSENGVENMNGKYTIANAGSPWPTDFRDYPGGVESFDYYHGPSRPRPFHARFSSQFPGTCFSVSSKSGAPNGGVHCVSCAKHMRRPFNIALSVPSGRRRGPGEWRAHARGAQLGAAL